MTGAISLDKEEIGNILSSSSITKQFLHEASDSIILSLNSGLISYQLCKRAV